jgi:hypothetical protein
MSAVCGWHVYSKADQQLLADARAGAEVSTERLRTKTIYTAKPGPWGELEYYVTYLQATDDLIADMEFPHETTTWTFQHTQLDALEKQISSCLSRGTDTSWLREKKHHQLVPEHDLILVHPPDSWLESIQPHERAALAQLLRKHPDNLFYSDPIMIESGDPVRWYAGSGMSDELIARIASLCYAYGQTLVFSDIPLVLKTITNETDVRRFKRALTRTRTLVVRLRVGTQHADARAISNYWSTKGHGKSLVPILQSLIDTPEAETLDIVHLLPPTPRKLLYSYPDLNASLQGVLPDCHWTSLNFFRFQPSSRFLDQNQVGLEIRENYQKVTDPLQFGDVLMLTLESDPNRIIHSCIYIADDIVYTKNGMGLMRPWILMRYGDMLSRYQVEASVKVLGFRRNPH